MTVHTATFDPVARKLCITCVYHIEPDYDSCIEVNSSDGVNFKGHYEYKGHPDADDNRRLVQLKLVRLENDELEFTGQWVFKHDMGDLEFNLVPE
jgi:hypothetical protein